MIGVADVTKGIVFDIQKFSLHDGQGIRTTVFLKGCSLRCWWCHNPESQSPRPELVYRPTRCLHCEACLSVCERGAIRWNGGAPVTDLDRCDLCGQCVAECYAEAREIAGREMTVAEVLAVIERDLPFYEESGGGVTFSGGEPLLQKDFLLALLRECRARDLHTALDTCGYAPWETLDAVRACVDLFLYDLKVLDDARHRHYTGVSNKLILENLRRLSEHGHCLVIRAPVIPGVNDDAEQMRSIAAFVAGLPQVERVDVLPYHTIGLAKYARLGKSSAMPDTLPPSAGKLAEITGILRDFGLSTKIGG